jgi:hypothetical protein
MVRRECEHVFVAFRPYGPKIAEQFHDTGWDKRWCKFSNLLAAVCSLALEAS